MRWPTFNAGITRWYDWLHCLFGNHVWWEIWQYDLIDKCIHCNKKRPHKTEQCTCTICKSPGGYEAWMVMHDLLDRK